MPLTPSLPSPLPKWTKVLIKAAPFTVVGETNLYDYVTTSSAVTEVQWRYVQAVFTRTTPATTVEDSAIFGLNIVNITGGQIDVNWSPAEYALVEGNLTELFTAILPNISNGHTLKEFRWYTKSFNPALPIGQPANSTTGDPPRPWDRFARMGPPSHLTPKATPGTNSGQDLPYQDAGTITLKTPAPKHWGRVYLPGLTASWLSPDNGRFLTTITTPLANAFAEFADDLMGNEFFLVVPHTQHDSLFATGLSTVSQILVDDLPDVIRRRRGKQRANQQIGTPTA